MLDDTTKRSRAVADGAKEIALASDLLSLLGFDPSDPKIRAASEDARCVADLISWLVRIRIDSGLRQSDVATTLGTSQSAVSDFERLGADPRISTVQRYGRALGTRLTFELDGFACEKDGWVPVGTETVDSTWTSEEDIPVYAADGDFSLAA